MSLDINIEYFLEGMSWSIMLQNYVIGKPCNQRVVEQSVDCTMNAINLIVGCDFDNIL